VNGRLFGIRLGYIVGRRKAGNAIDPAGAFVESKSGVPMGEFVVGNLELQLAVFVGGDGVPNDRSLDYIAGNNAVLRALQRFENGVVGLGA